MYQACATNLSFTSNLLYLLSNFWLGGWANIIDKKLKDQLSNNYLTKSKRHYCSRKGA